MPAEEWLEIRDSLTLALDGIETGPLDFIGLRQCVHYQREALRGHCQRKNNYLPKRKFGI